MTVPMATRAKPAHAQRRPTSGRLQGSLGHEVAEPHGDECRKHIGHRGAVRGDGAVIQFGIADPRVQRAAHEHLPFAQQQRRAEAPRRPARNAPGSAVYWATQLNLLVSAASRANSALSMTLIRPHMPSCPKPQNSWHGMCRSPGVEKRAGMLEM